MEAAVNSVSINGVTYVREDAVPVKGVAGSRFVVVVDRGWIFAGDLEELVERSMCSRGLGAVSMGFLRIPRRLG
jgi:hypothetical protein